MKPKRWDGRPIPTPRRGSFSYGALAAGASATGEVVFSPAFGAAPDVAVTVTSSRVTIAVTSVTATGFTWSASNWSPAAVHASQVTARWFASL